MVTVPFSFSRRFFEPEEVIISSCNSCFAAVGEAADEGGLKVLEQRHSCTPQLASLEQDLERHFLIAV